MIERIETIQLHVNNWIFPPDTTCNITGTYVYIHVWTFYFPFLTYGSLVRSPSFSMLHHTQKLGGASHGDEAIIINIRVSGYSCQSVVESFEDVRWVDGDGLWGGKTLLFTEILRLLLTVLQRDVHICRSKVRLWGAVRNDIIGGGRKKPRDQVWKYLFGSGEIGLCCYEYAGD